MPNPAINPLQPVTSKATPDRQQVVPVPEAYVGHNHPYRGTEDHGVPDPRLAAEVAAIYADGNPTDYAGTQSYAANADVSPDDFDNIVASVERTYKNPRRFVTAQNLATDTETRIIVSRNPDRDMVRVMNLSNSIIWIGNSDGVRPYTGYPLFPVSLGLQEYVQYSEDEIWAIGDSGSGSVAIAVVEEFTIYQA